MIRKIGVLGAGQMGNGIAHVFSVAGLEVRLYDIAESQLAKAKDTIAKNLERQAKKGAIDPGSIPGIMARIATTTRLEDMADIDFAVEAAVENEALKLELFRKLDGINAVYTTDSHFSLAQLGLVESLVLTLASDEFTLDPKARHWLEDDEYLVRRRIHRNVKMAMQETGA